VKTTAAIAMDWARRSFGEEQMHNFGLRSLRCAEEAVELAQAHEVPREMMHLLIDKVYDKAPGDPVQELGGVALTAVLMAGVYGLDLEKFFEQELRRVLSKSPEHFAKRNADKEAMGLKV
jgi:NTP pyrophosphatase (non-canonical NTP hydrolase)